MKINTIISSTLFICFFASISAIAQDFSPQVKEKISALNFMLGEWEGEGSMTTPTGEVKKTYVLEKIESDLNGTILHIRGLGTSEAAGEGKVVHQALGILSYNPFAQKYFMDSFIAKGMHTKADVVIHSPGNVQWSFEAGPGRTIRYTLKVENDVWVEKGEMSTDGENWHPFFSMSLKKKA